MSGGSYGHHCYTVQEHYVGAMYDRELDEMMHDLVNVLHDVEWWQSGDIGEDSYRETVQWFKKKWFLSDRVDRLKPVIDQAIKDLREELIEMIGGDSE